MIPRIICVIPFIFCLGINLIRIVLFGQKFTRVFSELIGKNIVYPINYWDLVNVAPEMYHYIILLFMSVFAFFLILMTFILFRNSEQKWIAFLVLGAGIVSRIVIGFSPTVFASGSRTFLFIYVALVIYGILLYQTFKPELTDNKQKILVRFLCIFAIIGYLESISYLFYLNIYLV